MATSTDLTSNPVLNSALCRRPGWARIRPCVFVLASMLIGWLICGLCMYFVGKKWEDSRRYLKNYRAPDGFEDLFAFTMGYAQDSDEKNDVVFLGDSSCMGGLISKQFELATGLNAFNLGTPGAIGIEGFVVILRRYLEHHPKPRLVVFCITPYSLQDERRKWGPAEVRENFMWSFGPETEEIRPTHQNPIAAYFRLGLWVSRGRLEGGLDKYDAAYRSLVANRSEKRGYHEYPRVLQETGKRKPRRFLEQASAIAPEQLAGLTTLFRLTQANDIVMLIRFSPVFDGDGPMNSSFVDDWPKELEDRFANVVVSRPLVLHQDSAYFADAAHCNRKGAEKFTALTAKEVCKMLHLN